MIKTKRVIAFILLITFLASLIFIGKVASTDAKKNSNTKKKITMTVGQKKTIKLNLLSSLFVFTTHALLNFGGFLPITTIVTLYFSPMQNGKKTLLTLIF